MNEAGVRATLEHYWKYEGRDTDTAHHVYVEDAVLEFPQSGERFVGVEKFREWRRIYPAHVDFELRRLQGSGDAWVAEGAISYDGSAPQPAVSILEFRGDKIVSERNYIADAWDAPEWRKPWAAASAEPEAALTGSSPTS